MCSTCRADITCHWHPVKDARHPSCRSHPSAGAAAASYVYSKLISIFDGFPISGLDDASKIQCFDVLFSRQARNGKSWTSARREVCIDRGEEVLRVLRTGEGEGDAWGRARGHAGYGGEAEAEGGG